MHVLMGPHPQDESEPRQIEIRIDDHDIWNLGQDLALIIAAGVRKLREAAAGAPFVEDRDVPPELRSGRERNSIWEDPDDHWTARWHWVLDEMIWSFDVIAKGDPRDQFYSGRSDWRYVEVAPEPCDTQPMYSPVPGPDHSLTHDSAAEERHEARLQNGLRLFADYCRCLWT